MTYDVYNKLGIPIYIDWKNSAFIPNDRMMSYWRDETNTEAISSGSNFYYAGISSSNSRYNAKAVHNERIAVVPPKSMISKNDYLILAKGQSLPKPDSFEIANSPIRFRNYLAYAMNEKFEGPVFHVDNSFYVSRLFIVSGGKIQKNKASTRFFVSQ